MHLFSINRVGIVFCGRQSPGGHNVIWGLHNALKTHNPNSTLLGFLGKHKSGTSHASVFFGFDCLGFLANLIPFYFFNELILCACLFNHYSLLCFI